MPKQASYEFFHGVSRFRFDGWHRLNDYAMRLHSKSQDGHELDELLTKAEKQLRMVQSLEDYSAFPSDEDFELVWQLFEGKNYRSFSWCISTVLSAISSGRYRERELNLLTALERREDETNEIKRQSQLGSESKSKPYFEVLIVDKDSRLELPGLKRGFTSIERSEDKFQYNVLGVPSFEDALIAILFNYNIQACVINTDIRLRSRNKLPVLQAYLSSMTNFDVDDLAEQGYGTALGELITELRPELDLYLVTHESVESIAGTTAKTFRRVFYRRDDFLELHLNLLRGVQERFETPFFNALKEYSRKPTGVFHAMPISRGRSVTKSHWIKDMEAFYGINIFLAETSATSGGLDSLLQPHGPIKKAQQLAARAFGARKSYFVTNGTSTANKIVVQALIHPEDIVMIDRDCHKSHHYGMVLSGARASYLDSYPLHDYSMYGAVPLSEIKARLLAFRDAGKLHKVKMLLLTNCTFDGVVYNVERVMEECLAIKPDLVFLWDEAWFAFARCTPSYRSRTAMATAERLLKKFRSQKYREQYDAQQEELGENPSCETLLSMRLLPNPSEVRIRVYATQSTHKSLTSLRQGSMIHIFDQDFKQKCAESFDEAFMTHTSTSPNYQIIASLDLGRRQVELEGYELVQKQVELAMSIREQIAESPKLTQYFHFLTAKDMIPAEYRPSKIDAYFDPETGWVNDNLEKAWAMDDFVIDPTRLTLYLGKTGIDGNTFKNKYLMDKHGIQINKTSRNTVLFMTNIGTTRSSVAFLIDVLNKIADDISQEQEEYSRAEQVSHDKRVVSLSKELPPLPDFSRFHSKFCSLETNEVQTGEGDIRSAFFMAYDENNCSYVPLDTPELEEQINLGEELVSAGFVIPYPPGFPILVPGQVVSAEIITFMKKLDVKEIHGYQAELGLRIFKKEVL